MIGRRLEELRSVLHRFAREERAVAAVEFALIMPFLIALYFGSMEAAALFTADKRVNSVSATVGDLVSQWDPDDGTLTESTITGSYMAAATGIMTPYSTTNPPLKIVVSLVEVKSDGTTKVLWSKANSYGTARTANSAFTPLAAGGSSSEMNIVARGGCIVAAETSYAYKPLLGAVFTTSLNLAHTNYFLPRYGNTTPINTTNGGVATTFTSSSCTT